MNYLFITAGLGSSEFEEAGERLISQVSKLEIFQKRVLVTQKDLSGPLGEYVSHVPRADLNVAAKFGFFSWKPALAKMAFDGYWGNFDSVCYLDAGCEVLPSVWTRKRFQQYLEKCTTTGAVVFHSNCPENLYTTQKIFELFPKIEPRDTTPQLQGGTWFLGGEYGSSIASEWYSTSMRTYALITDDFDARMETSGFIAPRNDQSFFSLTCKSHNIHPEIVLPPGGGKGFRTQLRSLYFPFRWARNRTGQSENYRPIEKLGLTTIQIYNVTSAFRNWIRNINLINRN